MKVVALVSGGKDSCYNMQLCQAHGHEIVALANLQPLEDTIDELDSFMYQTVGHQIVTAFAQCMRLPLFRRRIQGLPRAKDLRYCETNGDEVEDLEVLLRAVKTALPDVAGVSTGAIASDYQRLRVENVCSRLGLVSLAFMWKQEQASLLQDMARCVCRNTYFQHFLTLLHVEIESGLQAILVKVAALGLDPRKHLGKEIATLQPLLLSLQERYGCNVCGEGGEYESLTLDSRLFKHAKIVLDDWTVQLQSPDTIAPVGFLHPEAFHLEYKGEDREHFSADFVYEVTDDFGLTDNTRLENHPGVSEDPGLRGCTEIGESHEIHETMGLVTAVNKGNNGFVTISCHRRDPLHSVELRDELSAVLREIERKLRFQKLGWADVLYVHLYLDDMKDFFAANDIYMQHITERDCVRGVPSRSCVELPLVRMGLGHVLVEVLASVDQSKKVLHVQSFSSWAPCCIGPYSQATYHQHLVHMAGQLGLDPATMTLAQGGATGEMAQALKNCEAVGGEFNSSYIKSVLSLTLYCSTAAGNEDIQDVDGVLRNFLSNREGVETSSQGCVGFQPLVLYVRLPALPKGAFVEVAPLSYSSRSTQNAYSDPDDEEVPASWRLILKESSTSRPLRGQSSCRGLVLRGSLCRAFAFSSVDTEGESVQSGRPALEQALRLLSAVLQEAALAWANVFVLRIYFAVGIMSGDELNEALVSVLADSASEKIPRPTVVPVLAVGGTPELNDIVALELTASKG